MSQPSPFLLTRQPRARWMRLGTAQLLKRFYFCERMVLVSCAAWIPAIAPLEIKTGLARFIWQNAETAHALRNRVFELRFPSRVVEEEGPDRALVELFSAVKDSPSVPAFLLSVGNVLLPALRDAYQAYLEASDSIADGPTHRFLSLALAEKIEQIAMFERWAESEVARNPASRARASGPRQLPIGWRRLEVWVSTHRPRRRLRGFCLAPRRTQFRTGPRVTRISGPAASTGPMWSIPHSPMERGCNCNCVPPSVT